MSDEPGQTVQPGQNFGDYEVLGQLGTGGMGRVYKVRNVISKREEAMKVLRPDFASDPQLASRFMAEIQTLATLDHPGIAQLRTAFQYQNQFVMVMEFVEGVTLEKIAALSRIPLDRALDYAGQLLAALSYAHSRGVIHRDIKPANIMITTHGVVKLMDFGIAKSKEDMQLTRPGTTMGSVYYMSPEQVSGGTVDARSDLYSLGVTLYELLTGQRPFQADTSYSVLDAQLNKPPVPPMQLNPDLPAWLNAIVLKAMEKRPEDRFQTAEEFRNTLKNVANAGETAATAVPVAPPAAPQVAASAMPAPPSVPPIANAPQAPAAEPGFTPVPIPPGPAPVPRGNGFRGLWIALGATLALLALAGASLLLPRFFATHASQKAVPPPNPSAETQGAPATNPSPGAAAPASTPAQQPEAPVAASQPAASEGSGSAATATVSPAVSAGPAKPRSTHVPPQPAESESPAAQSAASQVSQPVAPPGPSPKEIRDAHDRLSNIQARAESVSTNLDHFRAQQQAMGVDLRGDIVASQSRMRNDLNEAQRYLNQDDLGTAGEYMDRADREIEILEKFLGR